MTQLIADEIRPVFGDLLFESRDGCDRCLKYQPATVERYEYGVACEVAAPSYFDVTKLQHGQFLVAHWFPLTRVSSSNTFIVVRYPEGDRKKGWIRPARRGWLIVGKTL